MERTNHGAAAVVLDRVLPRAAKKAKVKAAPAVKKLTDKEKLRFAKVKHYGDELKAVMVALKISIFS